MAIGHPSVDDTEALSTCVCSIGELSSLGYEFGNHRSLLVFQAERLGEISLGSLKLRNCRDKEEPAKEHDINNKY